MMTVSAAIVVTLLVSIQLVNSYNLPCNCNSRGFKSYSKHSSQKQLHNAVVKQKPRSITSSSSSIEECSGGTTTTTTTTRRKALSKASTSLSSTLFLLQQQPKQVNAITSSDAESSYNKYAKTYDELDGGSIAKNLGIDEERTRIIQQQAKGDVLEVAVGTGLNLSKYKFASSPPTPIPATTPTSTDDDTTKIIDGVTSLTLLDISDGMLSEARTKLDSMKDKIPPYVKIRLIKADATSSDITNMFGEDAFDTVLDTFSLCIMGNEGAKRCLEQMRNVVKNEKDGGQILLIENTRSSNSFLGMYQDVTASAAAKIGGKGCVSNQDVKAFIGGIDRLKIKAENEFASGLFRSYICTKQ